MVWLIVAIILLMLLAVASSIIYLGIDLMICAFAWYGSSAIFGFLFGLLGVAAGVFIILLSAQIIYVIREAMED